MNTYDSKPPATPPVALATRPGAPRSNKQIRANVIADGLAAKQKWKTLIAEAKATWERISPEELAEVNGSFHRLAGLVQLRQKISRVESDQQVRAFLDKHYAVAGSQIPKL